MAPAGNFRRVSLPDCSSKKIQAQSPDQRSRVKPELCPFGHLRKQFRHKSGVWSEPARSAETQWDQAPNGAEVGDSIMKFCSFEPFLKQ